MFYTSLTMMPVRAFGHSRSSAMAPACASENVPRIVRQQCSLGIPRFRTNDRLCPLRLPFLPQRRGRGRLCCAASVVRQTHIGKLSAAGLRFAIVVARFNDLVTKLLLEGTVEGLERHGAAEGSAEVVWVPGSFELPVVAKALAKSGKFDAVIAVGTVVRGATTHYEAVVGGATSGLLSAGTDSGVPVIFTVLTTETMEQALDRAGGKVGNKGYEGAVVAIEMANLLKQLRNGSLAAGPW